MDTIQINDNHKWINGHFSDQNKSHILANCKSIVIQSSDCNYWCSINDI